MVKIRDRSLRVPKALGAPRALRVSGPHLGPLGPLGPKPPFGFHINKKWRFQVNVMFWNEQVVRCKSLNCCLVNSKSKKFSNCSTLNSITEFVFSRYSLYAALRVFHANNNDSRTLLSPTTFTLTFAMAFFTSLKCRPKDFCVQSFVMRGRTAIVRSFSLSPRF